MTEQQATKNEAIKENTLKTCQDVFYVQQNTRGWMKRHYNTNIRHLTYLEQIGEYSIESLQHKNKG